MELTKKYGL